MTFSITLPDWDAHTWAWVGLGFYLLSMYAFFGPLLGRWVYQNDVCDRDVDSFLAWLFSPAIVPVIAVVLTLRFFYLKTAGRIIYGGLPPKETK